MDRKKIILFLVGAIFLLLALIYRLHDPEKCYISYEYIGAGTWSAGLLYYTVFQKYKEITSLLLGLAVLHAGVILLLIDRLSNPKLLGAIVFTGGVIIVLGSGFSDYMKRRKG